MFKRLTGIFLITLVLVMFVVYIPLGNIKEVEAIVVLDDVILIAVVAAICAAAGYIFYNYEDMAENALFIYANLPEASRVEIDKAVINGGTVVQVSGALVDNIYGIYWDKIVAGGEYLKDALNGIYTSVVEDFSFVIKDGKVRFINVASGGGYYSSSSAFPSDVDDLKHLRIMLANGTPAGVGFSFYPGSSTTWTWEFIYNGQDAYYSTGASTEAKAYFRSNTNRVIDGVTYSLVVGSSNGMWNSTKKMYIATMAVGNSVKDYIVRVVNDEGGCSYLNLWTPTASVTDYVLDDTNYRFASGSVAIDYRKDASTGVVDRDRTGNAVLGLTGTATRDITIPIDNPSSMLGTASAGALAGDWADTTEYEFTQEAVSASEAEWLEYTGDMKEMSLPQIIISKFPFCIPFDLAFAIIALGSPPVVPVFNISGVQGIFSEVDIDIDFSKFNLLATILRWGILIMFNIGLIKLTRTIIRG